jgi:hypothetical protein
LSAHDGTLAMKYISQLLPKVSIACKESGLSYVLSSSFNSLNNGAEINLTQWSDFVSFKNTIRLVLCTFAAF